MAISRDKINKLSHVVTDELARHREVRFHEDHNGVRLQVRRLLEELCRVESQIDQVARHKIASQKKDILEGSGEWDVLYRKYYHDELKRLGV